MAAPKKKKKSNKKTSKPASSTAPLKQINTFGSALSIRSSLIAKYIRTEGMAEISACLKLGFKEILRVNQSIEVQSLGLLDGVVADVIFVLRHSTAWLAKRYRSFADILDAFLDLPKDPGNEKINVGDDSKADIRNEVVSTPSLSILKEAGKPKHHRRQGSQNVGVTAPPRQIQEDKVAPMLEELYLGICVLTILEEEIGELGGRQLQGEKKKKAMLDHVLPLTNFTKNMFKNAEELLFRRGIRVDGLDMSSEMTTDVDKVMNELAIRDLIKYFRDEAWSGFKDIFLTT